MLFVSYLHTEYCGSAEYAEKGLSKSFPRPVPGNPGRSRFRFLVKKWNVFLLIMYLLFSQTLAQSSSDESSGSSVNYSLKKQPSKVSIM